MATLNKIAHAVVTNPAFESKDITGDKKAETFCNWGLRLIAEGYYGLNVFNGLSANQIHAYLKANWKQVDGKSAHEYARFKMVIAAQASAKGSGHVAVVLNDTLHFSAKWNKDCPTVANVGVKNGFMGSNFAFSTEPDYFVQP